MKIPFSILPVKVLRRISLFRSVGVSVARKFPNLDMILKQARSDMDKDEYVTSAITNSAIIFMLIVIFLNILQIFFGSNLLVGSIYIASMVSLFIFVSSMSYPKRSLAVKIKGIERNLLPALQDFLAQINSGVPIFNVIVNLSNANYGEVSKEFETAVREINAGKSQIEAIADLGATNPSVFFRRILWQISNGLTSGANMVVIVKESIKTISDEQLIQIQDYGSRLSPLSMFYMLIAIIIPILAITFIIILASLISLQGHVIKIILWGFYGMIIFMQIMFIGIIKSKRPNLI